MAERETSPERRRFRLYDRWVDRSPLNARLPDDASRNLRQLRAENRTKYHGAPKEKPSK